MTVDPRTLAADLRGHGAHWSFARNGAADVIEQVVVPLHDAWLKAKPPCPTCLGTAGNTIHSGRLSRVVDCPDCTDGVLPFDKWTAGLAARELLRCPQCGGRDHAPHVSCPPRQIGGAR